MTRIYSAAFPVNSKKTLDEFAGVVADWIALSPYRKISRDEISGIAKDGFDFKKGYVTINTACYEGACPEKGQDTGFHKITAIKMLEDRLGSIRTSEIIGHINNDQFSVTFTNSYEATKAGEKLGEITKPRIINDIIRKLGGGYDGLNLEVKVQPHFILEDDLPFVADIIRNKTENKLPVVYVSRDRQNITAVNPNDLAYLLGGLAHVIVEPSPSVPFTFKLKEATKGINAYNGAVGIYWPNGVRINIMPRETVMPTAHNMPALINEIHELIRESELYMLVPDCGTFNGIKGLQTAKRFEDLKKSHAARLAEIEQSKATGSTKEAELSAQVNDLDELLQLASDEAKSKDRQIEELKQQNYGLGQQLARCQRKASSGGEMLNVPQNITEFYSGELRDMVVAALDNYISNVAPDSRRQDMVKAVRAANELSSKRDEIVSSIDKIFKSTKPTDKVMSQLRALGFEVQQTGEVIVRVPGSGRQVHISSTPSATATRQIELKRIQRELL